MFDIPESWHALAFLVFQASMFNSNFVIILKMKVVTPGRIEPAICLVHRVRGRRTDNYENGRRKFSTVRQEIFGIQFI